MCKCNCVGSYVLLKGTRDAHVARMYIQALMYTYIKMNTCETMSKVVGYSTASPQAVGSIVAEW